MRLAENNPVLAFAIAALVCVVLIVGAQALATASAPPVRQMSQSTIVGQTGFAYLGGLRLMAAGMLWGRLDGQFHQYEQGKAIQDRLDLLPSIRLVQLLNPQLEQPYYYASYVLVLRHRMADAVALAREGIQNNPTSGLLRSNYIQVLQVQDKKKNLPLMLEQARAGLQPNTTFTSAADQFEAYGVFRTVFAQAGDKAGVDAMNQAQKLIDQQNPGTAAGANPNPSGFLGLLNNYTNSATPAPDAPVQAPVPTPVTK